MITYHHHAYGLVWVPRNVRSVLHTLDVTNLVHYTQQYATILTSQDELGNCTELALS